MAQTFLPSRRSIPASAGEARFGALPHLVFRVHPRERGGSVGFGAAGSRSEGPSPRARGKPFAPPSQSSPDGSIPASAGEAHLAPSLPAPPQVHPRERGGSFACTTPIPQRAGPSPRARGKPIKYTDDGWVEGSIPASAGEAHSHGSATWSARVHPRERGGSFHRLPS